MSEKLRAAYVQWLDSMGTAGWTEFEAADMRCESVGFVVHEDDDSLSLSASYSHGATSRKWNDIIQIPKRAITRRRAVKLP